jgi:hypothetical protein
MADANEQALATRRPWDIAMKAYLDAEAAFKQYDRTTFTPSYNHEKEFERQAGLVFGEPGYLDARQALKATYPDYAVTDEVHDEYERLAEASSDAEDALIRLPAPDHTALRWKLDKLFDANGNPEFSSAWSREYTSQTIRDYQRLLAA